MAYLVEAHLISKKFKTRNEAENYIGEDIDRMRKIKPAEAKRILRNIAAKERVKKVS
jgi:hypothetical protein